MLRNATMLLGVFCLMSCGPKTPTAPSAPTKQAFGKMPSGEEVSLFTLSNAKGMQVGIITYGARVASIKVPDKAGAVADVVLGFDNLEGYLGNNPYFGAVVGRYGNRIAKGKFSLNGTEYKLAVNNGENALHGGLLGFDKRVWTAKESVSPEGQKLELTYVSKDGEEGYPGTLTATVVYTLTDANELRLDYSSTTDKDTVANITNHSYFNLAGQGDSDVLPLQVTLNASKFTPVDKGLIPTGELRPVDGTPFDFRQPHAIGERIDADYDQIKLGGGYDHNLVADGAAGTLRSVAKVVDPKSGRTMELSTTEPGVQFYTGNFLDGTITGKGGKVYKRRYGFCLETQHFPDSPNHPDFPTTTLKAGATYKSTTVFKFSN